VPLASLVAGATLGGLVTGAVLAGAWYVLQPFDAARTGIVMASGALAAGAIVWPRLRYWLPERPCQVRSVLMHQGMVRAGFRWGVELGTGVYTYVVTPALYALLAVSVAQSHSLNALAIAALYGVSRGMTIAWFGNRQTSGADHPPERVLGVGLGRAMRAPLLVMVAVAVATAVV
jgi:hypothetical protein